MPDQIPPGCLDLKKNRDTLETLVAVAQLNLDEAEPSEKPRMRKLLDEKRRAFNLAQTAYNNCLANPPVVTPPIHIPGVPDQCVDLLITLNHLKNQLLARIDQKKNGGAADEPNIDQIIGQLERDVAAAQFRYNQCNPPIMPPVSAPVAINGDTTLKPVKKVISWSFIKKKVDEFINNRTEPPIFNIRLDNNSAGSPPASMATMSMLEAKVVNNQIITGYNPLTTILLGAFDFGYYFQDVNSSKISVSVNPLAPEPLSVRIDFECGGPVDMPSGDVPIPNMDFTEFHIILKLSFDLIRTPLPTPPQCDSLQGIVDSYNVDMADLLRDMNSPDTNHAQLKKQIDTLQKQINIARDNLNTCIANNSEIGDFASGQLDFLSWVDRIRNMTGDILDDNIQKYFVAIITTTSGIDPGGKAQKTIRGKVFEKLKDPDTKAKLNGIINRWILGGDGKYNVLSKTDDGENITLNYQVPANKLDPFPESTIRPAGWPYKSNPAPTITLPVTNKNSMGNIKHIVVLTMENRSFDHMLGYLSLPVAVGGMGRTDVDGLTGKETNPYIGQTYSVFPFAPGDTLYPLDPAHSFEPVFRQIHTNPEIEGLSTMGGFITENHFKFPDFETPETIMGYHTGANVPVYDALARDFAISDRWFSAHPGPTFSNRFYELTGRLNLSSGLPEDNPNVPLNAWEFSNSSPLTPVFTKTIFDYITEYHDTIDKGVTWKYYEHNYSFFRFFSDHTFDGTNVCKIDDPLNGFFADAKNGTLPSVSYIDPHYIELPPNANSDGPVADIKAGQKLVQDVVEAVVASPQFPNTLLVITYDEHGGFYDHVTPPAAKPFIEGFPISTYGVRIPAFFISPWVKAGSVIGRDTDGKDKYNFDTTSILKTIAARMLSKNPPYMGGRFADAQDISVALDTIIRKPQFLPFIRYNFSYNATAQMMMDISGPGETLWQLTKRGTAAQDFSFEQSGSFVYIRTHADNKYLSIDTAGGSITSPPAQGFGIKQDAKYQAGQAGADPRYQLWKLSPLGTTGAAKNSFVISNAFFPNKVLLPLTLLGGAHVVLVDKPATITAANTWLVTSPVLS